MWSFQVARASETEWVKVDEYLTHKPLSEEQKRTVLGTDTILRDTHEVPIVFFSKPHPKWVVVRSEIEHRRMELIKERMQELDSSNKVGMLLCAARRQSQ